MVNYYSKETDAAVVSYINICLNGSSIRYQKKRYTIENKEIHSLNEPFHDEQFSVEKVEYTTYDNEISLDKEVINKVILESAMQNLTQKEAVTITEIYFNHKKVTDLTQELQVSKNAILKTKRRALQKMRIELEGG
ncbi:hypothetical protein [Alkalibacillus silvisoli]|uniref:Sigma-70 family RNA polymerase sigma factor n=1 Tax=Alkalibacillus silvisoli TaxID=392823 RepID=A0ABN1A8W7_9BACI